MTPGPGGPSALRHWHTLDDEFVYILAGKVVLVTWAGEHVLRAGLCAGHAAGKRDAHHFANRGNSRASYSEVCNRIDGDNGFYPDDGLMRGEDESRPFAAHNDGCHY